MIGRTYSVKLDSTKHLPHSSACSKVGPFVGVCRGRTGGSKMRCKREQDDKPSIEDGSIDNGEVLNVKENVELKIIDSVRLKTRPTCVFCQ